MGRAGRWMVTAILTIVTFGAVLWVGALTGERALPAAWSDASRVAAVLAFASLLATIVFSIGKWWAERDGKPEPAASWRLQINTAPMIGGSGITGLIGGNVNNSGPVNEDCRHG